MKRRRHERVVVCDIACGNVDNVLETGTFTRADAAGLGRDAPAVLAARVPEYRQIFAQRGWRMLPALDRVYDNARARSLLGWRPRHDFRSALQAAARGEDWRSPLARAIGSKGYHR